MAYRRDLAVLYHQILTVAIRTMPKFSHATTQGLREYPSLRDIGGPNLRERATEPERVRIALVKQIPSRDHGFGIDIFRVFQRTGFQIQDRKGVLIPS